MSFMDDPESSERSYLVGQAFKPNEDSGKRVSGVCCNLSGRSSLMVMGSQQTRVNSFFRRLSDHWLPSDKEDSSLEERSWKRRLFLLLTEPETSLGSAIFYFVLIFAIFASNIIMIMQTMKQFQFTPDDCRSCGGTTTYVFEDDVTVSIPAGVTISCVCPPAPLPVTELLLKYLLYFFSLEWSLRVILFVPAEPDHTALGRWNQWFGYLTEWNTLLDAIAIFPYFLEFLPNSFLSLRLVRLFRIFQLVRLGQYNEMFVTLTNVLQKSVQYLRLLILILAFGGAIFGSLMYWLERGDWKYHEPSGGYCFVRLSVDGTTEEPSPFESIPSAFWWFLVTATTVGYGDLYPTSTGGKWCATFAMLVGVLVVAFPVSVFSDLWSNELKQVQGFDSLEDDDNRTQPNEPRESPSSQHGTSQKNRAADSDVVVINKQDLREIAECLCTIRENEHRVKAILHKYHHVDQF